MKNIQVIDGAENCSYSIFRISDESFALLFRAPGQDIEFIEDAMHRLGRRRLAGILEYKPGSEVEKPKVRGIHGTLFYQLRKQKKKFYPNKRETDLDLVPSGR